MGGAELSAQNDYHYDWHFICPANYIWLVALIAAGVLSKTQS